MSAEIIDGAKIAQDVRNEVTQGVVELQARHGIVPGLAAFLVGDNPASAIYVRNKQRACQEAGIFSETFNLPSDITQDELIERVLAVNQDDRFHGILVQLPLPPQIDESSVIHALDPDKDVDGLHPVNAGRMVKGEPIFVPCTPGGIQQLLLRTGNSPDGKKVVVCGRSEIVGKPIAILMMQKREGANATVTVCHTGTKDLAEVTRSADILVAAMGRARAITADMVKEGVVVIDVGINRVEDLTRQRGYRLEGDVDFEEVSKKAAAITPVPGGVGPMTVAMLLLNTLEAAQRKALVTTSHR
ncbi:MAG: bifunctional methylenetetrahydrofolate dehydrogenase/methenyltetrahydrofolate cyclohydrolase FolD [Dehalococcoidia bacterium]|nr:bifunctional methylenetetrahydrofolate dehydrogenase/methenyltetrahydrofolate cyclohydrolase FolD [Dehalococcoidia bacterium]